MFRIFLYETALLAAALAPTPAFADEFGASRVPDEPPLASAADPSALHFQAGTRTGNDVPPAPERGGPSPSLGIDLKIGGDGFRLGGRLSGENGVSEAWIGGQVRGDGVTLDGRLKGYDGPPRDFKLNVDLLPGWAQTAVRIWRMLP